MMKFRLEKNGARYELVEPDLRAGCVHARQLSDTGEAVGEVLELVSPEQFQKIVVDYVRHMEKKGVRRLVYAFEEKGEVFFYSLLPSQVKSLGSQLYSLNTTGKDALLSISFRATRKEKAILRQHGEMVDAEAAAAFHAISEANNGARGEVVLYGKSQPKPTASDGKVTLPSGKRAASQLKTCARNSSRSLSKSHDIWTAKDGIPNA